MPTFTKIDFHFIAVLRRLSSRCLAGRMAMHTCQIGPTDTAPPCPGSPLRACVGTKGGGCMCIAALVSLDRVNLQLWFDRSVNYTEINVALISGWCVDCEFSPAICYLWNKWFVRICWKTWLKTRRWLPCIPVNWFQFSYPSKWNLPKMSGVWELPITAPAWLPEKSR